MNIDEVRNRAIKFLNEATGAECIKALRVVRVPSGWEIEAEVFEEDSFIKSLGLQTKVCERNQYTVELDENLEVQSYWRKLSAA